MRLLVPAFVLLALAKPAIAQEKLGETIDVRVVNVDVVVRDRAGKPVPGLTKDDFEVFDNGKPQIVTNLSEVRPSAALPLSVSVSDPAATVAAAETQAMPNIEIRPRKIVGFIDNYSLPPLRR